MKRGAVVELALMAGICGATVEAPSEGRRGKTDERWEVRVCPACGRKAEVNARILRESCCNGGKAKRHPFRRMKAEAQAVRAVVREGVSA